MVCAAPAAQRPVRPAGRECAQGYIFTGFVLFDIFLLFLLVFAFSVLSAPDNEAKGSRGRHQQVEVKGV
jgi:hypothetical protein